MSERLLESDWQRIKEVLAQAMDLDAEVRRAFLDDACAGDDGLRNEVESLLASAAESADFIETPVFSANAIIDQPPPMSGRRFGNYEIVREIGSGGMGAVYLAKRIDGEFEQEIALKIVRQSVVERHILDRFRRERQILASLNHPNIARLFDGGISASGEPFLAMEYVKGIPITHFASENALDIDERLELFGKVCEAVAFAHNNLVIHRDIKPGNILVATDGEPKLLDFGLAKLLDDHLDDATKTLTAFRALTPAYASPEQLCGSNVTTVSDVYSLGVVLHELLVGARPFDFEGKSLDEIIKNVTEVEPPAPSVNPRSVVREPRLKGDLDNIVLCALRREPERRYRSVDQFHDDIDRFRKGLPIIARANTYRYRAAKFVKRHRFGAAAGILLLVTLIGGIVGSLWQARAAQREKEKAEGISSFLEDTLKYSNPIISRLNRSGHETTVNEILDEAAHRLTNGEFDDDPEVKADLERMIASTYFGQGKYQTAREHMAEHVALLRRLYGEGDPKYITGLCLEAGLLFSKGDLAESEAEYRRGIPQMRAAYRQGSIKPGITAESLNSFAYLRRTQGDSHEAEMLFRESLEIFPKLSGSDLQSVATTRSTLASTIADQGRFDEAVTTAQQAVDEYVARDETETPSYGFALNILGGFLTEKGSNAAAETALKDAEAIYERLLIPTNLWVGDNLRNQAMLLYNEGKYDEAVAKADRALAIYEEDFGKHYDQYPTVLITKGMSLLRSKHAKEGEAILREAVELRVTSLPSEHFWVAAANGALGECLVEEQRYDEAEPLLIKSFESLKASQEPGSPRLEMAEARLVRLYESLGH